MPLRFDPTAEETDPAANAPRAAQAADEDNEIVTAGWELLTPNPVPFSRYTDTDADPSVRYVYADATACKCIYVGDEAAYERYRELAVQQRIANEQQIDTRFIKNLGRVVIVRRQHCRLFAGVLHRT